MNWGRVQILGVCFLTACASPSRKPDLSTIEMPAQWTAGAETGEVQDFWWNEFGSTNLTATVEEALAANHDLKIAVARLDAAAASARIAGADLYPRADFGFDARRAQQNFVGLPIPGAEGRVLKSRSTTYGAALNLSWELDLWGRIRARKAAARADAEASENDLWGARNSLAGQTVKTWLATIEAARQLQLATATAETYRTTAEQVRERYERGIRSPLDLRLALASESSAKALAALRQSQYESAQRQLEIILGRYPAADLGQTNDLPTLSGGVPAGLPSELLGRRPDLVAAEKRFAASAARVREAKAALFPRISLTASGGRSSAELEDLLSAQFNVWSLAANLAQPLLQGGRLRAGIKLEQAFNRQALETYLSSLLEAFREVETALADERHLLRQEQELARATEQSVAALRLAEERYRSGLETFAILLESQRRALESESQWLAVRRARLDNRVDLHLALGGGFRKSL